MKVATVVTLTLAGFFFTALPHALGQAKANFAYSALDASYTAYWMAVEKGFFEKYGAPLGKSVFISGASILMGSMASGEIDVALVPANGPMNIQLNGGDITIFASTLNLLPYYVFFSKDMTQLKDIEGRRAGISQFGSGSHAGLLALFHQEGINPSKVTFVRAGGMSSRVAAFTTGQIDLLAISPPYHLRLTDQGYPVRLNLFERKVPWLQVALAARRSWVEKNEQLAEGIVKALAEGGYYTLAHPKEAAAIWRKYLKLSDQRAEEETWTYFRKSFVADLTPDVQGIANVRDFSIAQDAPKAKNARPEQFVTWGPIEALKKAKFFDSMRSKYRVALY
jgi:ABC-type nitrate/sulfonate/bicarbonate transport system substrate-binding protein